VATEVKDKPFVLPEHLEPYRDLIEAECGGLSAEALLNDHTTNSFNNSIKATLICMCDTKVRLLGQLHQDGLLRLPEPANKQEEE